MAGVASYKIEAGSVTGSSAFVRWLVRGGLRFSVERYPEVGIAHTERSDDIAIEDIYGKSFPCTNLKIRAFPEKWIAAWQLAIIKHEAVITGK